MVDGTQSDAGWTPDLKRLTWPRRTPRLLLRPLTVEDAPAAHRYRSDPEVTRYLSHGPLTLDEVVQRHALRVKSMLPDAAEPMLALAIEDASGLVGDCMVRLIPSHAEAWIGYAFAQDAHGRGYGTEVARALVEIAGELGVRAVYATTRPENVASQRVLEKAGLVRQELASEPDSVLFRRTLGE